MLSGKANNWRSIFPDIAVNDQPKLPRKRVQPARDRRRLCAYRVALAPRQNIPALALLCKLLSASSCAFAMDQKRQESQLEIARRYVRDGEERIARLNDLIAETRALAKPTDELEDLLARYRDWLELASFEGATQTPGRLYCEVSLR